MIKYRIYAEILVEGIANESDIVGALFGQTEGLLEDELDFKQLQNMGKIGRIVLNIKKSNGKTRGIIQVPSNLSKVETAIIAATLEQVDRVGPCSATIKLKKIEDERKEKRKAIAERAAQIMRNWKTSEEVMNLQAKVLRTSKRGRIQTYGPEKLAAGPDIYNSDEIILVEGRADVEKLLKYNISNAIELRGATTVPPSIRALCKKKTVTAFLDGDRGGDVILKTLASTVSVDFVARAPFNKEVEKLSRDLVEKALAERVELAAASFLTEELTVSEFLERMGGLRHSRNKRTSLSRISPTVKKAKTSEPRKKRKYKRSEPLGKSTPASTEPSAKAEKVEPSPPSTAKRSRYRRDKKARTISKVREQRSAKRSRTRERRERTPRRERRRRPRTIAIPDELKGHVESMKQSFHSVLLDDSYNPIAKVPTASAYESLKNQSSVSSIIIDGVITQRILDLAQQKHVKYVIGAVVGNINPSEIDKSLTFATYSRIN